MGTHKREIQLYILHNIRILHVLRNENILTEPLLFNARLNYDHNRLNDNIFPPRIQSLVLSDGYAVLCHG